MATRRPRYFAGEISAIYIGDTTDAPPTAKPPMNRKNMKENQSQASAQPIAETKNSTASAKRIPRLPKMSAGRPTTMEPMIVPISALETVKPRLASLRLKCDFSQSVVPEITAVSKPNRRPPKAATRALDINAALGRE